MYFYPTHSFPLSFSFPPTPLSFCRSDSDQQWFPAHWFEGFGGVICVIRRILPWHGRQGRGWWEKRDKNRWSDDKGVLMPRGRCFFKSIFSMADSSGHSAARKDWVALETCAVFWRDEEWGRQKHKPCFVVTHSRLPRLGNPTCVSCPF